MVSFNFAPQGWAFCDGSLLSISANDVLFTLLGTTYGGDGINTFALPDLRGRIPFHQGTNSGNTMVLGQLSGSETVTLVTSQLPAHTHTLNGNSSSGNQSSPANMVWAKSTLDEFSTEAPTHSMAASSILPVGGSQPHDNMPPFTVLNFIIALYGVYPSQS